MKTNKNFSPGTINLSLEVFPAMAVVIDTSFNIVDSNKLWENFLNDNGYAVHQDYMEVFSSMNCHKDDVLHIREEFLKLISGNNVTFEYEYICESAGERKWFKLAATRGEGNTFLALHYDIDAYKSREQLLKKYEGKQKRFIVDINKLKENEEYLKLRNDEISFVYEAGKELGSTLNLKTLYNRLFDVLQKVMRCDNVLISSYCKKTGTISCIHAVVDGKEMSTESFPPIPLDPEGGGTQSTVIRTGSSLLIKNYKEQVKRHTVTYYLEKDGSVDKKPLREDNLPLSAILVPYVIENEVIGLIQVQSYEYESYGEVELKFLEAISQQVAAATVNARLYEQVNNELRERKKIENNLRKSEEKLRRLLDHLNDALIVDDEEGNIIYANDVFYKMYMLEGKDVTGLNIQDYVAPEWRSMLLERHKQRIKGEDVPAFYEYEGLRSDGSRMWVEVSVVPVTEDGVVTGTQSLIRDITDRKRAQKMLEQRNSIINRLHEAGKELGKSLTLSNVYNTVYHVIKSIMKCDSLIISSYNAEKEMLTCEFVVLEDKIVDVRNIPPIPVNEEGYSIQSHSIITGESLLITDYDENLKEDNTSYFMHSDGTLEESPDENDKVPRTALMVPLKLENKVIGVIQVHSYTSNTYTTEDLNVLEALSPQVSAATANAILYEQAKSEILHRRKAEREIRMLNEELEERVQERTAQLESANRELEAFSYTVSHDLRAPLRAIDGFSRLLGEELEGKLDPESKRLLSIISGSTRKMGKLIDDMLDFSRLSKQVISHSAVNMNELVSSVAEELKSSEPDRSIKINISKLENIECDISMMRQVWVNLIANSLKFTSKKENARIDIGCERSNGKMVYFIKDNGVGFNPKYSSKLFKVFERLHNEKDFEGTGVGLAIVHRIISRHGGKVRAEGETDKGAAFYISLPQKDKQKS